MYTVYILQCRDGSLYTGFAKELKARLAKHNSGKASKYTRSRLPVRCVYSESQPNQSAAKKREWELKSWPRSKKLALAQQ